MTETLKRCQYVPGFIPVGPAQNVVSMPAAAVSIARGDILKDDTYGYLTNASITAFAAETAWYVAIEPCDNSGGSSGDLNVLCILVNGCQMQFWVPVEDQSLIARGDVGTIVDLQSEDGIDVDAAVTNKGIGFLIEGFDASTGVSTHPAYATYPNGFALGRFIILGETT